MNKGYIAALVFSALTVSCKNSNKHDAHTVINPIMSFLISKKYHYHTEKEMIPKIVFDSLKSGNDGFSMLADASTNVDSVNMTDTQMGSVQYKRKLNFILLNDTICLMSYAEGGIGKHNVLDFIQYKGDFVRIRRETTMDISDTALLQKFILTL